MFKTEKELVSKGWKMGESSVGKSWAASKGPVMIRCAGYTYEAAGKAWREAANAYEVGTLLTTFVKMAEVDLGEDEHKVDTPLTHDQFVQVQLLVSKLQTLINFVDVSIFEDPEDLPGTVK